MIQQQQQQQTHLRTQIYLIRLICRLWWSMLSDDKQPNNSLFPNFIAQHLGSRLLEIAINYGIMIRMWRAKWRLQKRRHCSLTQLWMANCEPVSLGTCGRSRARVGSGRGRDCASRAVEMELAKRISLASVSGRPKSMSYYRLLFAACLSKNINFTF